MHFSITQHSCYIQFIHAAKIRLFITVSRFTKRKGKKGCEGFIPLFFPFQSDEMQKERKKEVKFCCPLQCCSRCSCCLLVVVREIFRRYFCVKTFLWSINVENGKTCFTQKKQIRSKFLWVRVIDNFWSAMRSFYT